MAQNENRRRVHQLLESPATGTSVPRSQVRIRLPRKLADRSKLVRQVSNIRQRLRELTKSLETKETEIEIEHLEEAVAKGSDGEKD